MTRRLFQAFLIVLFTFSGKSVARDPIVKTSDPTIVTHRLKIGQITIGFSDKGGGYLNYLDTGDGNNIVSTGYGRGWQGSLRDQLHSGRYNPTQAGFTDFAGAPVSLRINDNRLSISRFNLPLFGDPVFDFTEHEDLAPDSPRYKDNGNADTDGVEESSQSQDDEIRSEFDFEGYYENASKLCGNGKIPILRFYSRYTYARSPSAILQFGKQALKMDGGLVINPQARVSDVSVAMPGKQEATDIDLSKVIFTAYGIRLLTQSGYTTPMWYADDKWHSLQPDEISGRGKEKVFLLAPTTQPQWKDKEVLSTQLLLLAKGVDPKTSPAIALYAPQHLSVNRSSVLGLDKKEGKILYEEDRRTRSVIMFSHVIPSQIGIRSRFFLSGLLAPEHGNSDAIEALQQESYILFGTPQEILECMRELERIKNVEYFRHEQPLDSEE